MPVFLGNEYTLCCLSIPPTLAFNCISREPLQGRAWVKVCFGKCRKGELTRSTQQDKADTRLQEELFSQRTTRNSHETSINKNKAFQAVSETESSVCVASRIKNSRERAFMLACTSQRAGEVTNAFLPRVSLLSSPVYFWSIAVVLRLLKSKTLLCSAFLALAYYLGL